MGDRVQRWTEAQRAQQRQNAQDYFAQRRYGYGPGDYKDLPGQGQQMFNLDRLRGQYGAFADPTWQYQVRDGQLYQKAMANQTGRIAAGGGDWQLAPDYAQRGFQRAQAQPFEYGSQRAAANHLQGLIAHQGYTQVQPGVFAGPTGTSDAYGPGGVNIGAYKQGSPFQPSMTPGAGQYPGSSGFMIGDQGGLPPPTGPNPAPMSPDVTGYNPAMSGAPGPVTNPFRIGDLSGDQTAQPDPSADPFGINAQKKKRLTIGSLGGM